MDQVNELNAANLTVVFLDENGLPTTPVSVSYRIDCLTTGQSVRPLTPIIAQSTVVVPFTPDDTTILDDNNGMEVKRLTVEAQYGPSDSFNDKFDYQVRNLRFIP